MSTSRSLCRAEFWLHLDNNFKIYDNVRSEDISLSNLLQGFDVLQKKGLVSAIRSSDQFECETDVSRTWFYGSYICFPLCYLSLVKDI